MVTSYYIMKLNNRPNIDFDYYYNTSRKLYRPTKDGVQKKCRICLNEATVHIFNDGAPFNMCEALKMIADVDVKENDDLPQHICNVCYKLLRAVISFKNTAKKTDEALRKVIETSAGEYEEIPMEYTNEPKTAKRLPKVLCRICKRIVCKTYFKQHLTMHDPNHHNYVCDICGKSFRLKCAYYNHSWMHKNSFPHKCPVCPYRGRYKVNLTTHMKKHSGEYTYMCTECPARFLFQTNLHSHILRKHKEPELKCEHCSRGFHSKLLLQRHIEAVHLGIKNHICKLCGKAFGYKRALTQHERHVHKKQKSVYGRMPSYLVAETQDDDRNMSESMVDARQNQHSVGQFSVPWTDLPLNSMQ